MKIIESPVVVPAPAGETKNGLDARFRGHDDRTIAGMTEALSVQLPGDYA